MKKNLFTLPSDARFFIPHRDAMLMIDTLDVVEPDMGKASVLIRKDNIFYEDDVGLNPVAYVECIAQTAAAHNGYMDLMEQNTVRPGFLAAVKDFHVPCPAKEGDKLDIQVKRILEINHATVLEGKITTGGGVTVAVGTLNLWIIDDELPSSVGAADKNLSAGTPLPSGFEIGRSRDLVSRYILDHLRLVNTDKDMVSAGIRFNSDFIGFNGHFPASPVLPGIVTLQMAVISTEICLNNRIQLLKVDKTKFMQPALPDQWVDIECKARKEEKDCASRVTFSTDDRKIASVMLHYVQLS